ncbi:unnamed protein product [Owenia fusiformis]|uniref:Uncharacterized protein n=1 Tax=Owenia fusiformis TaxID=6347 RepID=A0A8J1UD17_OWEFU|nr:unnamed protein product [Owenia fusiformis]
MHGLLLSIIVFLYGVSSAWGHGIMIEPPARPSLWRYGYRVPKNYEDNQVFCGGYAKHWYENGGKCGPCGDPWEGPRDNEAGGKYAKGIIVRKYQTGQTIDVYINITVNHWGWFEFKLCPNNDVNTPITHDCLDQFPLEIINSDTRFDLPSKETKIWFLQVKLPPQLECSQCVLQWKYHGANRWGTDPDGWECTGCGPQEEFYACADIAIGYDYDSVHAQLPKLKPERKQRPTSTAPPGGEGDPSDRSDPRIIIVYSDAVGRGYQWQSITLAFSVFILFWNIL